MGERHSTRFKSDERCFASLTYGGDEKERALSMQGQ